MRKTLKAMSVVVLFMVFTAGIMLLSSCDKGIDIQARIDGTINSAPTTSSQGPSDSQAGQNWTPQVINMLMNGVAWSGTQYVAVGPDNAVLTSPDGEKWTPQSIKHDQRLFGMTCIIWSGTQFVAIGEGDGSDGGDAHQPKSLILTSPDGINWTERYAPAGFGYLIYGVAWSGSRYAAVGDHVILTSSDGITWTPQQTTQELMSIAWSGTQFATVGSNGAILTSPDGVTWTARNSGTSNKLNSIAWSETQFVAVGEPGWTLTSPDGIAWTAHPAGIALRSICSSGSLLVALGTTGIYSSSDGIIWTKRQDDESHALRSVVWAGNHFVGVGYESTIGISSDGITWTMRTPPMRLLRSVASSGKLFAAVGNLGTVVTSSDGETWTPQSSGVTANLTRMIWSGTQFVAVGGDGADGDVIITSPDGRTWASRTDGADAGLSDIAWSGNQFAAVAVGGRILTSPDGVHWSGHLTDPRDWLNGIVWSGTQFTVVGWRCLEVGEGAGEFSTSSSTSMKAGVPHCLSVDIALTSPDGATWTTHVLDSNYKLDKVTWTGTQFIATDFGPDILTSSDGFTWTTRITGSYFANVVWTGAQAVAVGSAGAIATSPDGIIWTSQSSGTTYDLTGVAWSGTRFVAVGPGIILTSP